MGTEFGHAPARKRAHRRDWGNSQAMALTLHDQFWGEKPGAGPGAVEVFQPGQSFFEEPFSPAADDFASGAEPVGDLIIGEALLGEENHLGASNHKIRQRIFIGASLQLFSFLLGEHDLYGLFRGKLMPSRQQGTRRKIFHAVNYT